MFVARVSAYTHTCPDSGVCIYAHLEQVWEGPSKIDYIDYNVPKTGLCRTGLEKNVIGNVIAPSTKLHSRTSEAGESAPEQKSGRQTVYGADYKKRGG